MSDDDDNDDDDDDFLSFRVNRLRSFQSTRWSWEERRWAGPPKTSRPRRTFWRYAVCRHGYSLMSSCAARDHSVFVFVFVCSWRLVRAASTWCSTTQRASSLIGWKWSRTPSDSWWRAHTHTYTHTHTHTHTHSKNQLNWVWVFQDLDHLSEDEDEAASDKEDKDRKRTCESTITVTLCIHLH